MVDVSVIIVTFNAGKTLSEAIDSVLQQKCNFELILIDGESTDDTIDIIRSYGNKISYWISEPDNGIYDAMNKGWKVANGKYIHYLGADDLLLADSLNCLLKEADDCDVVYGNTVFNHSGNLLKYKKALPIIKINETPFCSHQSMIMKRNLFVIFNGFDATFKILADYDLILKTYIDGYRFKYVDIYVSQFSIGGASFNNFKADFEKLKIYRKYKLLNYPLLVFYKRIFMKSLSFLRYLAKKKLFVFYQ